MKKLAIVFVMMFFGIVTIAQGAQTSEMTMSGNSASKSFAVSRFHEIEIYGDFNVVYIQRKGRPEVQASGSDDAVASLYVGSNGETLEISSNRRSGGAQYEPIDIVVYSPYLEDVEINGDGTFKTASIRTREFSVEISGNGEFQCGSMDVSDLDTDIKGSGKIQINNLRTTEVDCDISGNGEIILSGQARRADLEITGSGIIDISGLRCNNVKREGNGTIRR